MEEQLLPREELKPAYDKVVWLWVYRDFKKSPEDRAAERTAIRFGLSSYPQHFLIDPATLKVLANTGRELPGFLAAVDRVKVKKSPLAPAQKLKAAEARAIELEESPSVEAARKALADEDAAVLVRALEVLSKEDSDAIAARALTLLEAPNDVVRYLVLDALAQAGDRKAAEAVEGLFRNAKGSENPNVLRMHAAKALGACGDAGSIEVLAALLANHDTNNGANMEAVKAVAAIGKRLPEAREQAVRTLCAAYPPAKVPWPAPEGAAQAASFAAKMGYGFAKKVHEALHDLTGKDVEFPNTYDEAVRSRLQTAW